MVTSRIVIKIVEWSDVGHGLDESALARDHEHPAQNLRSDRAGPTSTPASSCGSFSSHISDAGSEVAKTARARSTLPAGLDGAVLVGMRPSTAIALVLASAGCSSRDPLVVPDAAGSDAPAIDASLIDAPDEFDMAAAEYSHDLCVAIYTCAETDGTLAECEASEQRNLLDAKAQLDDARELQCAACLRVVSEQARAYVAAACDPAALDEAAIPAACDLTPDNGPSDGDACGGLL